MKKWNGYSLKSCGYHHWYPLGVPRQPRYLDSGHGFAGVACTFLGQDTLAELARSVTSPEPFQRPICPRKWEPPLVQERKYVNSRLRHAAPSTSIVIVCVIPLAFGGINCSWNIAPWNKHTLFSFFHPISYDDRDDMPLFIPLGESDAHPPKPHPTQRRTTMDCRPMSSPSPSVAM